MTLNFEIICEWEVPVVSMIKLLEHKSEVALEWYVPCAYSKHYQWPLQWMNLQQFCI